MAGSPPSGRRRRSRRHPLVLVVTAALLAATAAVTPAAAQQQQQQPRRRPVIFDTDIGTFVDDTLALGLALASAELDVVLVVVTSGDLRARARVAARQLRESGREDIPIALGAAAPDNGFVNTTGPLYQWAQDEVLEGRPGGFSTDGVGAMRGVLRGRGRAWPAGAVDLLVLGPSTTVAELLRRYPEEAEGAGPGVDVRRAARLTVMGTSVCAGVLNPWSPRPSPHAATNEAEDVPSARTLLSASWGGGLRYSPSETGLKAVVSGEAWAKFRAVAATPTSSIWTDPRAAAAAFATVNALDAWWNISASDPAWLEHSEAIAEGDPLTRSVAMWDAAAVAMLLDDAGAGGGGGGGGGGFFTNATLAVNFTDDGYTRFANLTRMPDGCVGSKEYMMDPPVSSSSALEGAVAVVTLGWSDGGLARFQAAFADAFTGEANARHFAREKVRDAAAAAAARASREVRHGRRVVHTGGIIVGSIFAVCVVVAGGVVGARIYRERWARRGGSYGQLMEDMYGENSLINTAHGRAMAPGGADEKLDVELSSSAHLPPPAQFRANTSK